MMFYIEVSNEMTGGKKTNTTSDVEQVGGRSLDAILDAMASERARRVLYYFTEQDSTTASLTDLSDFLVARDGGDGDQIRCCLHHGVLPELDDAGLLEYDGRDATVRYRGHPATEELLAFLTAIEAA